MNILDIILIIPIAYGIFRGYRAGFIKEISSIVGLILAIYSARYFSMPFSDMLVEKFDLSPAIATPISYSLVFIVVMMVVSLLSKMVSTILKAIMLGFVNRVLGAIFGAVKYLLVLSVILNFISLARGYIPAEQNSIIDKSVLYSPIKNTMDTILPFLKLDDFEQLVSTGVDAVSNAVTSPVDDAAVTATPPAENPTPPPAE